MVQPATRLLVEKRGQPSGRLRRKRDVALSPPHSPARGRCCCCFYAIHFFPHQEDCFQADNERVILTVWRKYCGETTQKKLSHGGIYLLLRKTKKSFDRRIMVLMDNAPIIPS